MNALRALLLIPLLPVLLVTLFADLVGCYPDTDLVLTTHILDVVLGSRTP